MQLLDRWSGRTIYANTAIEVLDLLLVAEVTGLLFAPELSPEDDAGDAVSHVILELIPPSSWHEIEEYSNLVKTWVVALASGGT